MNAPFIFGKAVSGSHFTDRKAETHSLVNNFKYGINTIIISPRRYGKTSLVKKAGTMAADKDLKVVYLDIFTARSPREFGEIFADALLKQTSSIRDEIIAAAKELLSRLRPKYTIDVGGMGEMSLSLDIENEREDLDEILELPEKIAKKKNCRIVVCIDEFQQVSEFNDSLHFQKRLRTHWQHHQYSSYCLFGSKKHMMNELFALPSMPFYKFGDVINLKKIPENDWIAFILERFNDAGKPVTEEIAAKICRLTENYSSYVQQLSWLFWTNYNAENLEETFHLSYQQLIDHSAILFEQQTQDLTEYQLNFLKMLLEEKIEKHNSAEAIRTYNLGSPANIARLKSALIRKELVEIEDGKLIIRDPILKVWLRRKLSVQSSSFSSE